MNSEERELISRFIARVGGGQGSFGSPATGKLPAIDPEADRFIADNFQRYPEARYRVTQLAVVQEAALAQAQNRIRELETQLQQARAQQSQPAGQSSGGFFSNMFGRGGQPQVQPQQRSSALPPGWGPAAGGGAPTMAAGNYASAPGAQPSMFPRSGSGFLGSALTTAAGVAGGMMAADALEGLFSGHHGHEGGGDTGGGFGDGQGDTFITNNYGDSSAGGATGSDPFGGSGTEAGGFMPQDFGADNSGFAPEDNGQDMSGDAGGFDDGGGFDDNSF